MASSRTAQRRERDRPMGARAEGWPRPRPGAPPPPVPLSASGSAPGAGSCSHGLSVTGLSPGTVCSRSRRVSALASAELRCVCPARARLGGGQALPGSSGSGTEGGRTSSAGPQSVLETVSPLPGAAQRGAGWAEGASGRGGTGPRDTPGGWWRLRDRGWEQPARTRGRGGRGRHGC